MSRRVILKKTTFSDTDSRSLKIVYLLAVHALGQTHHVDDVVTRHLAEAVFEAYVNAEFPRMPLSHAQTEDLALMSIELLAHASPELLVSKH